MQNEKTCNMETKKIFGLNLKAKVVSLGLTREQAVEKINEALKKEGRQVTLRTFNAWLYGENEPPLSIALTMQEVFLIDDIYLFGKKNCA